MTETMLKKRLTELKEGVRKPSGQEIRELIPHMLAALGSVDSILRDDLIYELLSDWIVNGCVDSQMLKWVLSICTDQHLFNGLGELESDTVFSRSFALLVIASVIHFHNNRETLLNEAELIAASQRVFDYAKMEKDWRGYVFGKGWAHAVAHLGDCLDEFARAREFTTCGHHQILEVVATFATPAHLVFTCGEDERLVTPVVSVANQQKVKIPEVCSWIEGLVLGDHASDSPYRLWWKINARNFLRSLYFRTVESEELLAINQTTFHILRNFR